MRDLSSGYALGLGVGSSMTSGGSSGRGIGMGRGGSSQGDGAVGSGGGCGGVPGGRGVPGCWANGAEVSAGNRPIRRLLPGARNIRCRRFAPRFRHRRRVRLVRRPPWRGKADCAACRHVALLTPEVLLRLWLPPTRSSSTAKIGLGAAAAGGTGGRWSRSNGGHRARERGSPMLFTLSLVLREKERRRLEG
jgi:hypothetical protein